MRCFLSDASISVEPGTVSRGFFHAKPSLVQHRPAVPFTGRQNNAIVVLRFHWVYGRSSKILLLEACLLPLTLVGFIGSLAEAAKSCLRGVVAAFDLGRFHRVFGGGSKILLLRRGCCL